MLIMNIATRYQRDKTYLSTQHYWNIVNLLGLQACEDILFLF